MPQSDKSVGSVGAVAKPTGAEMRGGAWVQVSRLGAPLVNELVIGLPDKDRFNASRPQDDGQFADYVTNPSLPVLLQALFGSAGVVAPNVYPRTDLVAAFLTGVSGLNQPANVKAAEELRLNTSTAVTPVASQKDLGVLAGDTSGFPNGRTADRRRRRYRIARGHGRTASYRHGRSGHRFGYFADAALHGRCVCRIQTTTCRPSRT